MTSQLPQQPPSTSFDLYSGLSGSTGLLQIDSTNSPAELSIEGPRRCHEIQLTIAWASPPSCPALCDRLLCDQRLLIQGEASRERAGAAGGFCECQPPRSPQVNEKLRPTRRL